MCLVSPSLTPTMLTREACGSHVRFKHSGLTIFETTHISPHAQSQPHSPLPTPHPEPLLLYIFLQPRDHGPTVEPTAHASTHPVALRLPPHAAANAPAQHLRNGFVKKRLRQETASSREDRTNTVETQWKAETGKLCCTHQPAAWWPIIQRQPPTPGPAANNRW